MKRFATLSIAASALGLCIMLGSSNTHAADSNGNGNGMDLFDLPLETLLDMEVTSVSKRPEKVSEAAAAIYVITNEDIRRAGITSIPEALRLAPGIQVARVDSNKWAISSRGFNGQLANKLLVLMDGRDIYTPLFSGVNWDVQDTLIEDIDRIEVIRGSGATLWGANAVNGVINIITKKSKQTQGTLVTATFGTEEQGAGGIRHGGTMGKDGHYRVYAKGFNRNNMEDLGDDQDAGDNWRQGRAGFRADWNGEEKDTFTLQGDVYWGEEDRRENLPSLTTPFAKSIVESENKRKGANILGRWLHTLENGSTSTLQVYYDKIVRNNESTLKQSRDTIDLDFQHNWDFDERNELIWGVGYRVVMDNFTDTGFIDFEPGNRNYDLLSAFVQDKYSVIPDVWYVTVGTKIESNDYTGFEYQPNIRTSWIIDENQTAWAAISRAVRTPSRAEDDINIVVGSIVGVGLLRQVGSSEFDSEDLLSYELGYRAAPRKDVSFDIAAFFNEYDDLRTLESSGLNLNADNKGEALSYGVEVATNWEVTDNWELTATYTSLTIETETDGDSSDSVLANNEGESPRNQASLRSEYSIPDLNLELDSAMYYVDTLPTSSSNVEPYIRVDARIGWKPTEGLDISLVGQNLFDDQHQEFDQPTLGADPTEILRSVYIKATLEF